MLLNFLTKNAKCGIIQRKNSRVFNIDTGFSVRFGRFAIVGEIEYMGVFDGLMKHNSAFRNCGKSFLCDKIASAANKVVIIEL